jgi:hypothetical protein
MQIETAATAICVCSRGYSRKSAVEIAVRVSACIDKACRYVH